MMQPTTISFNNQAPYFDARAGLSVEIAQKVAQVILEYGAVRAGDLVLDVGAGTGEIGAYLSPPGVHYIGFDLSPQMLEQFRLRLPSGSAAQIVCADANGRWPAEKGSARVVFGSRVFHLLNIDHVMSEMLRVKHLEGSTLILGKVRRKRDSVKAMMREKMREFLSEEELAARPTERLRARLFDSALSHGATFLEPMEAASWRTQARPIDSILSWEGKDSMGGIVPSTEAKKRVLGRLLQWSKEHFGDPEKEVESTESYMLEGLRFSN